MRARSVRFWMPCAWASGALLSALLLSACPPSEGCLADGPCDSGAPALDAGAPRVDAGAADGGQQETNFCDFAFWCNDHGVCNRLDQTCSCYSGYTGERCGDCQPGFQDNAGDNVCRPDCAFAALDCGAHGSCSDATGVTLCVCEGDFVGTRCDRCADGLQRRGDACLPPPPDAGPDAESAQDAGT